MSSKFSKLLGSSKLAQVAKPVKPYSVTDNKYYPTHQTIQTTSASLHRHDFGLKAALPAKIKSRYVIVDDLDTFEHLTSFEPNAGLRWAKLRFQEMGVPVTRLKHQKNPLFIESFQKELQFETSNKGFHSTAVVSLSDVLGIDTTTSSKTIKAIQNNLKTLREDFHKYVLENHPEKLNYRLFNKDALSLELLKFIRIKIRDHTLTQQSELDSASCASLSEDKSFLQQAANPRMTTIEGTGGLSYLPKNRLKNSIHGFHKHTVVPGRLVGDNNTFAVGGFITQLPQGSFSQATSARAAVGKHFKEIMIPGAVRRAILTDSGAVKLDVASVNKVSKGSYSDSDILRSRSLRSNFLFERSLERQGQAVVNLLNAQF